MRDNDYPPLVLVLLFLPLPHLFRPYLDIVDGVRGLDLEGDGLTREGLDEDLHTTEILGCWVSVFTRNLQDSRSTDRGPREICGNHEPQI
jgi:hypothetical protein